MSTIEVKVPDIGDFNDVPVIEIFVKPGDTVKAEDSLVTLESDKATMDVPAPVAGTVKELKVKLGDKIAEGVVILTLETADAGAAKQADDGAAKPADAGAAKPADDGAAKQADAGVAKPADAGAKSAGVSAEKSAPAAAAATPEPQPSAASGSVANTGGAEATSEGATAQPAPAPVASTPAAPTAPVDSAAFTGAHAPPSVRKFARELGVDLARVTGTGPKGRIQQQDVQSFVKQVLSGAPSAATASGSITGGGALNLLPWPVVDFTKFGPIEPRPLSRIKKLSGANLARNWVMIPHVTQFDEADITELETFRVQLNKENEKAGIKVTMLAFLIKASVAVLRKFPDFNASLDGDNLVLKQYFNIGFAADTPNGLVVPVIKNADQKGVLQIAREMGELSAKAREGKLGPPDMQGGCFSISSLGGIGGTAFTPIINAPEVAILGVSKSAHKPVWDGKEFVPRLMVPLSLSYDHRVIDGASAARFTGYLASLLADMRRVVL